MERDFPGLNWPKGSSETATSSHSVAGDPKIEAYCQKEVSSVPHFIHETEIVAQQDHFHPPPHYSSISRPSPNLISKNSPGMTLNSFPPTMDYASSSPRLNQPMTIFYGNEVYIYNDVSPQWAREIAAVALSSDGKIITNEKLTSKTINVDEVRIRDQAKLLQNK